MGDIGPLFGIVFYLLVLIAAISSAISLIEVVVAFFGRSRRAQSETANRSRVVLWVCAAVAIESLLVAIDGLGASGVFYVLGYRQLERQLPGLHGLLV